MRLSLSLLLYRLRLAKPLPTVTARIGAHRRTQSRDHRERFFLLPLHP
jgi:hypothetical protein